MLRNLPILLGVILILALPARVAMAEEPLTVDKAAPPSWLERRAPELDDLPDASTQRYGAHLLLLDFQRHVPAEQMCFHYAHHIVNQEGVDNYSDIFVTYQPAFESLTFNIARIHRQGQIIDQLPELDIEVFRREQFLELGIYDGEATAVINLHDVRPGDVVEYAYTRSGSNPLLDGHLTGLSVQQLSVPVRAINYRIIAGPARDLQQRSFYDGGPLAVSDGPHGREYTWSGREIPALVVDDNVPYWYDPSPRTGLSSFADWAAVVDWAEPMYRIDEGDLADLREVAADLLAGDDREVSVRAVIRFVQDDVRYLAREEGIWGLQPRRPGVCVQKRFGDCKDKSLLLVALLGLLDIEAFPLLVSTDHERNVGELLPSHRVFNHCIVGFEHDGETIFVDPTIAHQGGGVTNRFCPDYGLGLPIRPGADALVALPSPAVPQVEVLERFEVDEIGTGGAAYTVTTRYRGLAADTRRAYFTARELEQAGRDCLQFYSAVYPGIELSESMAIVADRRDRENELEVVESYQVRDIWQISPTDTSLTLIELYPLEIESYVGMLPTPGRKAPYYAGEPIDISINSEVLMPESWAASIAPMKIGGEGFNFVHSLHNDGPLVHCMYHYRRTVDEISAADTPAFLAAHSDIMDKLGVHLYYTGESPAFVPANAAIALAIVALGGALIFVLRRHRRFDPEPRAGSGEPLPIGGWLIVLAVILILRPLRLVGEIVRDPGLFDQSVWDIAVQGMVTTSPLGMILLMAAEIVINALLLVGGLWLILLFFQRRSSFPRVFLLYVAGSALLLTLDTFATRSIMAAASGFVGYSNALMAWLHLLIWGPYLLKSKRVARTFVQRAGQVSES